MAASLRTAITELGGVLATAHTLDSDGLPNVTGNSSGSIYVIDIDNTNNTVAVYLKIIDHAVNVGAGQIADMMFRGTPGKVTSYVFDAGIPYAAGVSIWCTTYAAVASDADPGSSVTVSILAS
mgnify:CR=1 FL=1